MPYAGHVAGDGVCCQANIMASAKVWPAMLTAFEQATGPLVGRLALVASAIAQQPGWRELLARLAPEQWPVAGPLLERLRAAGRASQG